MPFLVSSTAGAYLAGSLTRRLGKSKMIIVAGLFGAALGFFLLATSGATTGATLIMVESVVLGSGIGLCMPTTIVVVQNAVERRDVGSATGALLLLRSMGGAFGSTIAGSLLTLSFGNALRVSGIHRAIDLGSLSQGAAAFAGLPGDARKVAIRGLVSGFGLAYLVSGALLLAALMIALRLRDLALRSTPASTSTTIGH
jgi:MFS family permease